MTDNTPPQPSLEETSPQAGQDEGYDGAAPPSTRVLKAVVIVLGLLLIAGFGLVATTIIYRLTVEPESATSVPPKGLWGVESIPLPPGGKVEDMILEGDRLVVRVATRGGGAEIIIMDIRRGHEIGRFSMERK
ncbi:MAG: hypothetical protein V6Z81_06625 [Parvularculales bacterium]